MEDLREKETIEIVDEPNPNEKDGDAVVEEMIETEAQEELSPSQKSEIENIKREWDERLDEHGNPDEILSKLKSLQLAIKALDSNDFYGFEKITGYNHFSQISNVIESLENKIQAYESNFERVALENVALKIGNIVEGNDKYSNIKKAISQGIMTKDAIINHVIGELNTREDISSLDDLDKMFKDDGEMHNHFAELNTLVLGKLKPDKEEVPKEEAKKELVGKTGLSMNEIIKNLIAK